MLQLLEFLGRLGLCLLSELGSATACYRTNLLARPLLSALSPGTRTCLNLLMFFIAMMMEDCFLSPFTSLCYFWPSRVDIRCLFQLCTHNAQILEPGFYSRRDGVCTCRKEGSRFFVYLVRMRSAHQSENESCTKFILAKRAGATIHTPGLNHSRLLTDVTTVTVKRPKCRDGLYIALFA
jgi:hypothetical protein